MTPLPLASSPSPELWTALVYAGQAFYFSRFLIQWIASEGSGRSESPRIFWWLSLLGVVFAGTGAVGQEEWILVPAFLVNLAIYLRNISLPSSRAVGKGQGLGPIPAAIAGALLAVLVVWFGARGADLVGDMPLVVLWAGILGQGIWSTRFILQWWFSERRGQSHFPILFWWLSALGAVLNLIFTAWLGKPEFMIGYLIAWFVPVRNLTLEYRLRSRAD
jgi:lipid-A-disaccharide synthase-like uncharacterized protein